MKWMYVSMILFSRNILSFFSACCRLMSIDVDGAFSKNVHAFNSTFQTILNSMWLFQACVCPHRAYRQTAYSVHTTGKTSNVNASQHYCFVQCFSYKNRHTHTHNIRLNEPVRACVYLCMKHTSASFRRLSVPFFVTHSLVRSLYTHYSLVCVCTFLLVSSFPLNLFRSRHIKSLCSLYSNHKINIIWLSPFFWLLFRCLVGQHLARATVDIRRTSRGTKTVCLFQPKPIIITVTHQPTAMEPFCCIIYSGMCETAFLDKFQSNNIR